MISDVTKRKLLSFWFPDIKDPAPIPSVTPAYDISVLVPVHNAMPYLPACLTSLATQTRLDGLRVQLVLVNDHSTDGSDKCVQMYTQRLKQTFTMVLVRECAGTGAAAARNACMRLALGKYVVWVDADDLLFSPYYLRALYQPAKTGADIVQGRMARIIGEKVKKQPFKPVNSRYYDEFAALSGSLTGKLFDRRLFEGLRFPENLWFEDTVTQLLVIPRAASVASAKNALYGYRENKHSLTYQKNHSDRCLEAVWVLDWVQKEAERLGIPARQQESDWNRRFAEHTGALLYNRVRHEPRNARRAVFEAAGELLSGISGWDFSGPVKAVKREAFVSWEIKSRLQLLRSRI